MLQDASHRSLSISSHGPIGPVPGLAWKLHRRAAVRRGRGRTGGFLCVALALTMASCGEDDAADGADEAEAPRGVHYLAPEDHLVRVSMALRGTRPDPDDLSAVAHDPDVLPEIVDRYLETAAFGETMRDLHNEALLVLVDYPLFPAGFPAVGPVASADLYELNRAVMEGPLRLVEHVIMQDRPYTEIVTADYTVANGLTAAVWGLPYDGDGPTWVTTQWTDGRDNAGILSDSWLFQRHQSTISNANRGRANAVARALVCHDFLSRDIEVDGNVDLADPDVVADAVVRDPACASCHQALDPMASFFAGFFPAFVPLLESYPHRTYDEDLAFIYGLGQPPSAYFGNGGQGLGDLGTLIAADPRFTLCAAKRFHAYFHQTNLDDVPLETATRLQRVLIDSGMDAKALTRAIVLDDAFRISHVDESFEDDVVAVYKARPLQLGQLMRDLTGFSWQTDLYGAAAQFGTPDLLEDPFFGYQVLAGGLDSMFVTHPSHTYSATTSLVLRSLAREAAHHRVDRDLDAPSGQRWLLEIDEAETSEAAIREQLAALHARIYSERVEPDSSEVDETWALFSAALRHSDSTRRAWKVTLTAMLQDVRIAFY
jgi:hypothetical protein